MKTQEGQQEILNKDDLEKTGENEEEKALAFIRAQNPGKFLPTGKEYAEMCRERQKKEKGGA